MIEWSDARKSYNKEQPLSVLDLSTKYYYDDKMEQDLVTVEGCATLELTDTSSGLQSVIPLEVVSEYLTDYIYKEKEAVNLSVRNKEINKSLENKLYNDLFKVEQKWGDAVLLGDGDLKFFKSENDINEYLKISQQFLNSYYTRLYIEEAEQNIFPTTQIAIIYHLLQLMNLKKEHSLFLTTHSPYVLYALNNCMMAYLVKDVMPMEEQQKLKCYDSRISPQFVSAYEVQEGTLKPIQTQNNRTIGKHYFNRITNEVMDEYYDMLEYLGDNKE
jgi:predicted ATP-dependent endonuclease of OLD family